MSRPPPPRRVIPDAKRLQKPQVRFAVDWTGPAVSMMEVRGGARLSGARSEQPPLAQYQRSHCDTTSIEALLPHERYLRQVCLSYAAHGPRCRRSRQPRPQIMPPEAHPGCPAAAFTTRFFQEASNKTKNPVNVVSVRARSVWRTSLHRRAHSGCPAAGAPSRDLPTASTRSGTA